jgi:hypothetical protein
MERVLRMKTATNPILFRLKPLALMAATAVLTAGLGTPLLVTAQDSSRTIATGTGIPLAADAPDRYTVKQGDTLWDISKVFLRDAWFWPEIWYLNPQVKNPHLIFPGDTLVLTSVDGKPQVTVAERGPEGQAAEEQPLTDEATPTSRGGGVRLSPRVRSEPLSAAVQTIPYDAIAAFVSRPTFLTKKEAKSGPYLVGSRDLHTMGGEGDEMYARGIQDSAEGIKYNIIHVDEEMRDPENGKLVGYRGIFVGQGTVVGQAGDPTKLKLGATNREALHGDRLVPEDLTIPLDFQPRAPADDIKGTVMGVGGVAIVGQYQSVAINRGTKHGIQPGHVLAILQRGEEVRDIYKHGVGVSDKTQSTLKWGGSKVKLPDERIGVVMVYKSYEQVSYALIMEATHPVRVGDLLRTP